MVEELTAKLHDAVHLLRTFPPSTRVRVVSHYDADGTAAAAILCRMLLREGYDVGLKVTLRGQRMYEFLDRLISVAVPRVRDFRGLDPSGFDGRGNYGMGVTEYGVFPEINPDKVTYQQGMNITICTTARSDGEARLLLTLLGMPFRS